MCDVVSVCVVLSSLSLLLFFVFFFFNDTATTEIYTLSLHDALPIWNDFSTLGFDIKLDIVKILDFMSRQLR